MELKRLIVEAVLVLMFVFVIMIMNANYTLLYLIGLSLLH